ncbi:MAG: hypothetical protein KBG15_13980 [Kofleriaceae bacterium]|nr:hypothetical protein [Kofleriaceae bacterium]
MAMLASCGIPERHTHADPDANVGALDGRGDAGVAPLRLVFHNDVTLGEAWVGTFTADNQPLAWRRATNGANELEVDQRAAYLLAAYRGFSTDANDEVTRVYVVHELAPGDTLVVGERDVLPTRSVSITLPPLAGASSYVVSSGCGSGVVVGGQGTLHVTCVASAAVGVVAQTDVGATPYYLYNPAVTLGNAAALTGTWQPTPVYSASLTNLPVTPAAAAATFHRDFLHRDFSIANTGDRGTGTLAVPALAADGGHSVLSEFAMGPNARMSIREIDPLDGDYQLDVAPRLLPRIDSASWANRAVRWSATPRAVTPDAVLAEITWSTAQDVVLKYLAPFEASQASLVVPPLPADIADWVPSSQPSSLFVALTSVAAVIVERQNVNANYQQIKAYALDEAGYWALPHGTSTFGPISLGAR